MLQHDGSLQRIRRGAMPAWARYRIPRPVRLTAAAAAVAAVALGPVAIPAHADALECQRPVLDLTDAHVLDTAAVTGKAVQLSEATGADVFVRAFQSTPGGSAAVWWADAYRECPAWLGADRKTPKPNVLVVEFGMDHTSAVEYGSSFHRLDSQVDRLRAGMGTHLRQGDYTGAVTETLSSIQVALTSSASESAKPTPQMHDSSAVLRIVGTFLAVIAAIALVWLVVALLVRLRAARMRRISARRRLTKAHNDAATAVLASDLTAARLQLDIARGNAEGGVGLEAIEKLAADQGELSGEFAQWAGQSVPKYTDEIDRRAACFETIAEGLQKVQDDADTLVEAAEKRVSDCTLERKRADVDAELQLLDGQEREIAFLSVNPTAQKTALKNARNKLTSLAVSMDRGDTPLRNDVDTALCESAAVRATVADQVAQGREAHADLNRISEKAQRAQEKYSSTVAGVTTDTAALAVSDAKAVERDIERLQRKLGAGELELDSLISEVATLNVRVDAATAEADRQHKKHKAARRTKTNYSSRSRSASSDSSDFSTGLITGAILGSHNDSSSSSSYDYGGGSSGGWDSGFSSGGDFGGGSSGGW